MACKVRGLVLAIAFAAVLAKASAARGQQGLPPAPLPAVQPGASVDETGIPRPLIPAQPPSPSVPPPNSAPAIGEGHLIVPLAPVSPNGPVVGSPPILMPPPPPEPLPPPLPERWADRGYCPPVGWFASVETSENTANFICPDPVRSARLNVNIQLDNEAIA